MSDEMFFINFSDSTLQLNVVFTGDDYEKATVKFTLISALQGVLEESAPIPVKSLFDMSFLIGMCIRRTAAQYEMEVQEMIDKVEQKKHPFKTIGGENDKKDKKTGKNK